MNRLESLDFLRGWAAVLVVISHLVGVFWAGQPGLQKLMGYQSIGSVALPYADWIVKNKLLFGQLGVAIFFILSGFVITRSLERFKSWGFLINRAIRIYPVYISGFCVLILGLYLVDFEGDGIPYTYQHLLIHSLIIVRQWFGYTRIDGISWTLEIELYFYVIMFSLFQLSENINLLGVLVVFFISALITSLRCKIGWYESRQIMMVGYMLLGYFFYMLINSKIHKCYFFTLIISELAVVFSFFNNTKPFALDVWGWFIGYLLAPFIFGLALLIFCEKRIDPFSKFLANISYPLYVSHAIFGYSLLVCFLKSGCNEWFSLTAVMVCIVLTAYLIHFYIEKPSIQLSRKFNH